MPNDQTPAGWDVAHRPSGITGPGPATVVAVASVVGLGGFLYPFLLPLVGGAATTGAGGYAVAAPLIFALLTAFAALAIVAELGGSGLANAKVVALLGVLVAIDATLRLVPTFLGASPIFLLIMLVGTVFGASLGFQMGVLTLLLSGFLTGGVGPWLPYQMLAAGWVGLTAGWLPRPASPRRRILLLAAFGALWGWLFGALLNLSFWPFTAAGITAPGGLLWSPGLTLPETVSRYVRFYLATSLAYDTFRALGNAALVLTLGTPILRVLDRAHARFAWEPWEETEKV